MYRNDAARDCMCRALSFQDYYISFPDVAEMERVHIADLLYTLRKAVIGGMALSL